jgi:Fe-S cluster assembly iron-binding protein IscA
MNMNCPEARLAMQASIGSAVPLPAEIAEHLASCEACAQAHEEATLAHVLRVDAVPPPRDGFVDAVIATAIRAGAAPRSRVSRIAASIAVTALVLGMLYGLQRETSIVDPPTSQHVALVTLQGKTVRVVIDSHSAQPAATVTIELAENLEMAGFPLERRIEFKTDLAQGKNLLALPLTLTDASASYFDVVLAYGSTRRNIRVSVSAVAMDGQTTRLNV